MRPVPGLPGPYGRGLRGLCCERWPATHLLLNHAALRQWRWQGGLASLLPGFDPLIELRCHLQHRPLQGEARLYQQLFTAAEAENIFKELLASIAWKQDSMHRFGKQIKLLRLTAW